MPEDLLGGYISDIGALGLLMVTLAALLVGVAKAGFGGGVGVIATPLAALAMPVPDAAALMLPVLLGADIFAVRHYRRDASGQHLRLLLPAAAVGVVAGALVFDQLSQQERALKIAVGILALAFVAWQVGARALLGRASRGSEPSPPLGMVLGLLSGFGSTLAHVGGPPVTIYLLPRSLSRVQFVATNAWYFFVLNLLKLVPYAILGLLTFERLTLALALLPVAWLGTWLGVLLIRKVDESLFTRLVMVLLTLTGLQLLLGRDLTALIG